MKPTAPLDMVSVAWSLAATLAFVLLNGFFVAAEFSLVKVRPQRIAALAEDGSRPAAVVRQMLGRMDLYLSSCQLGITVASLILGWLAEPAIARLVLTGAAALGWQVGQPLAHGVALGVALAVVTTLHMTLGEQAPKIFAVRRPEPTALVTAYPLKVFTLVLRPLIWVINAISNHLLRLGGVSAEEHGEGSFTADELRQILSASARAGHISPRQRRFAENVLGFIDLEVRHIMVPRIDVVELRTGDSVEGSLDVVRRSQHSRFPLCEEDLDAVVGVVHAKDTLAALIKGEPVDLRALAREPVFLPDTQSLGRMIVELQRRRSEAAIVLDDRGTAIGMVFLEDALEEIVGPIQDEFDHEEPAVQQPGPGVTELRGDVPLPEALELLGMDDAGTDDTIGGHVVSLLGRLPRDGDELELDGYKVTVVDVDRHRILRLRFQKPGPAESAAGEGKEEP